MSRLRTNMSRLWLPVLYIALGGFIWCTVAYISTGYLLPNLLRILCFVLSATLLIALLIIFGWTLVSLIKKSHRHYLHFQAFVWFLLAAFGVLSVVAVSVGFWYGLNLRAWVPWLPSGNWLIHGGPGGVVYLVVVLITAAGLVIKHVDHTPSQTPSVKTRFMESQGVSAP